MPTNPDVVSELDVTLTRTSLSVSNDSDLLTELPAVLAGVVAAVLEADGASLSLLGMDLRVPLGASNAEAATAELLQFTLGEGPCLDVLNGHHGVAHGFDEMMATWPVFANGFVGSTPFRSVASVPLPFDDGGGGGALDLYYRQPDGAGRLDLSDAARAAGWTVARLLGSVPTSALAGADDASALPWLSRPGTRRRMEVWVAIGVLSAALQITTVDALALLRGWAHSHGTDVDAAAADIAAGRLSAERLRP